MKEVAAILAASLVVTSCAAQAEEAPKRSVSKVPTDPHTSELKETLTRLEKQSWEAWQKRDGTFFQKFLSDDHVEVGISGPANKAAIVAFVGSPVGR